MYRFEPHIGLTNVNKVIPQPQVEIKLPSIAPVVPIAPETPIVPIAPVALVAPVVPHKPVLTFGPPPAIPAAVYGVPN